MSDTFDMIDPPVNSLSPKEEIALWIKELEAIKDPSDQVIVSIKQAKEWLEWKNDAS